MALTSTGLDHPEGCKADSTWSWHFSTFLCHEIFRKKTKRMLIALQNEVSSPPPPGPAR